MKLILLSLGMPVIVLCSSTATAATTTRYCDYKVYIVKGGQEIEVPNGRMTAQGKAKKGDGGSDERNARHDARDATEKCLADWAKSPSQIPPSCKPGEASRDEGAMTRFELPAMSEALNKTLCMNPQTQISNIDLMVKVDEKGDKARECKLHGDKEFLMIDSFNWGCNLPTGPQALTQAGIQSFLLGTVNTSASAVWANQKAAIEKSLAPLVCNQVNAQLPEVNKQIKKQLPRAVPGEIRAKRCKGPGAITIDLGDSAPQLQNVMISALKSKLNSKGLSKGATLSASTNFSADMVWGGHGASIKFKLDIEHNGVVFDNDLPDAAVKFDGFKFKVPISGQLQGEAALTKSGPSNTLKKLGSIKLHKIRVDVEGEYKVKIEYPTGLKSTDSVTVVGGDLGPQIKPELEKQAATHANQVFEF